VSPHFFPNVHDGPFRYVSGVFRVILVTQGEVDRIRPAGNRKSAYERRLKAAVHGA
jgi:hypothetical protein